MTKKKETTKTTAVETTTETESSTGPKFEKINLPIGMPAYLFIQDMTPEEINEQITDPIWVGFNKSGILIGRRNENYTSVSPSKDASFLGEVKKFTMVNQSKLPVKIKTEMYEQIDRFFAAVYEKYKSEVAILLIYNEQEKRWAWTVPHQTVAPASANYDEEKGVVYVMDDGSRSQDLPEGYVKFGSIHSHAAMSAFHSGVDDKDEFDFDGLHITLGNYNKERSYSARWIFSGSEFKVKAIDDVVDMPTYATEENEDLMALVSKRNTVTYVSGNRTTTSTQGRRWPSTPHTPAGATKPADAPKKKVTEATKIGLQVVSG